MKFDAKHDENDYKKRVSPQSAMDDYFGDMFGTSEEDPLKKLESQDDALRSVHELADKPKAIKKTEAVIPPEPKRQQYEPVYNLTAPQYDEPVLLSNNLSPLIIPAAFPKLAPAEPKVEIRLNEKVEVAVEVKTKASEKMTVQAAHEVKAKIDSATALKLLNKQKSKLSPAQKIRLKEKLNSLSKVKQQSKIQDKPVQVQNKEAVISEPKVKIVAPQAEMELKTTPTEKQDEGVVESVTESTEDKIDKSKLPEWAGQRFECLIFHLKYMQMRHREHLHL